MGGAPPPDRRVSGASPGALLEVALEAAEAAAELLLERAGERPRGVRTKSTPTDLVSEADLAAERAIRGVLAARRPGDSVLGEEGGEDAGASGVRWVVDPLDGTVNFLFGIPQWSVSVACEDGEGAIAGVVLDPSRGERFTATRDGPALLGSEPLRGSGRRELASAMVSTGFAYDAAVRGAQAAVVARLLPRVRDIRRFGSAALDLCWTAAGRYDAYYERGLNRWDLAAGGLVCRRAGLRLRELRPSPGLPGGLLAAPEGLADALLAEVG